VESQELTAELHRVTSDNPGEFLVQLVSFRERIRVCGDSPGQCEPAPEINLAEAGNGLTAGDSIQRIAVADAGPVVRLADHGRPAEAHEQLGDHLLTQNAVPVEPDVLKRLIVP